MLQIYKASAGSGKTHTLTGVYLRLAFEHPSKFKEILAVTFTNKAAGEMKERILHELLLLANKGEKSPHFDTLLEAYPKLNTEEIQAQAKEILKYLLHNYSDFSISTIDSFVQRVLRSFAFEIGVHGGYAIEFDTEKVINELNELLFEQLEQDKQLLNWLVDFANFKIRDGKNWDFRKDIASFTYEIFKENFQQFGTEGNETHRTHLFALHDRLKAENKQFEDQMASLARQAQNAVNAAGLAKDFNRNIGYILTFLCEKINRPTDKKDFTPNNTVLTACNNFDKWKRKSDKDAEITAFYNPLNPILESVLSLHEAEYGNYLLRKNLLSNFHALGVAFELARILPDYREQNNLLLISDSNHLLRDIIRGNDAPFIYEKIGNHFKNILIDEFQDTSGFQWENFKPLLVNALAEGTENLIVGDVKQSIYRWRGGDWNLLLNQVKEDIGRVKDYTLDVNWRSKPNIIEFNNLAFQQLITQVLGSPQFDLGENKDHIQQLKDKLQNAYADVAQQVAPKKFEHGGKVDIRFVPAKIRNGFSKEWREVVHEQLPQQIEKLIAQGIAPRDIAILTRKNADAREAVDVLLQHMQENPDAKQYQLISSEALNIANSDATRVMLAAMRVLHNPNDLLSWSSIVNFHQHGNSQKKFHKLNTKVDNKQVNWYREHFKTLVPDAFLAEFSALRKLSLQEIVGKLQAIFKLNKHINFFPYLQALEDMVLEFFEKRGGDLLGFLLWWDETAPKRSLQLSEEQDAVKVLTIHKSKGLAFKTVLIPFCDWPFDDSRTGSMMWADVEPEQYGNFPVVPLSYSSELVSTPVAAQYITEHVYRVFDALNMLYVALTRPKDGLYIWAPVDIKKATGCKHISEALYLVCEQEAKNSFAPHWDNEALRLNIDGGFPASEQKEAHNQIQLKAHQSFNWRDKLSLHRQSGDFFKHSVQGIADKVNYGNLMHEIFSKIETTDDVERILNEMRWSGQLGKEEVQRIKKQVNAIIARPQVSDWFSDKWEVFTEQALITRQGEIRIPDRVLFSADDIVVIDFKFGEQRDEYLHQIDEYAKLIAELEPNKKIKAYLYYANSDKKIELQ